MQQVSTTASSLEDQGYQRDLGQGLLLRWSTPEDVEQLVTMFANVLRSKEDAPPNHFNGHWVREMMSGRHPHSSAFDFALVEETRTKKIVASSGLFTNTVTYEDIPFTLGRTSIVGTEIPYRNRGLQRAIIDLIHARSAARGNLVQGITGIHYFYRQFGYEYAIDLEASRHIYIAALSSASTTETAAIILRPAIETDIPILIDLYARERSCWQIATVLDEQAWRWMLFASDPAAGNVRTAYMITTAEDKAIGYLLLDRIRRGPSLGIWGMAVKSEVSLVDIAPQALAALRDLVPTIPCYLDNVPPLARFRLEMGPGHALFDALGPYLAPECKYAYAWWMRIPDVPAFIRHIAPVLEHRLGNSALSGFTGELTVDFYRGGLRLAFGQGKLVTAEEWRPSLWEESQAGFPPDVFTQLLLGYRSFMDLRHIYKDVWAEGVNRTLLETIFPPRPSYMLPLC